MTAYANGKPEPIVNQLVELLPPNSHVLDIGCGEGRNTLPLARAGMRVECWDSSEAELNTLRQQADREGLDPKLIAIDMRSLFIGFNRWNAILTILSLHYLRPSEAEDRLFRIRQNLKPGGFHALVAFTGNGAVAKLRDDRFFPSCEKLLEPYAGWQILTQETSTSTCIKPGPQGQKLENERLTLLARKPL